MWCDGASLMLLVDIFYLRQFFADAGRDFRIHLLNGQAQSFERWDQLPATREEAICQLVEALEPEILDAHRVGDQLRVVCAEGLLTLSYATHRLFLDTGREISLEELQAVATRYWTSFGA
jgi:hypothetical protein